MKPNFIWFLFLALSAMNVAMGVRDYNNDNMGSMLFDGVFAAWMLYEAIRLESKVTRK